LDAASLKGFSDGDSLSRKSTSQTILNLISNVEDDLTLLLAAPWGTGKTVFATRMQAALRASGVPNIYFDAFAHDLSDDAYSSLLGAMFAGVQELLPGKKKAVGTRGTDPHLRVQPQPSLTNIKHLGPI